MQPSAHETEISRTIRETLAYIERSGLATYDPVDASGTPLAQRLSLIKSRSTTNIRRAIWLGLGFAPIFFRKLLRTELQPTAGGMANLASAYCEVGDPASLKKARECLDWLHSHATRGSGYIGWGFPFAWKQTLLVTPGTPIGHTTMTCANAFLKYFHATQDEWALKMVQSACEFFHSGLRHSVRASGSVAVSYTPLDQMQVINVQGDVASILIRTWKVTGEERHRELGLRLLRCVLETQNPDGSWYYYTQESLGGPSYIDNHHTGMVLSALAEILADGSLDESLGQQTRTAISNGTEYFLQNLFTSTGMPKYYHNSLYPIEIYNFAQTIITCLDLRPMLRDATGLVKQVELRLEQVVSHLLQKMRSKRGGFLFRRYRIMKEDLGSLRWANALTTMALCRYQNEFLQVDVNRNSTATLQGA